MSNVVNIATKARRLRAVPGVSLPCNEAQFMPASAPITCDPLFKVALVASATVGVALWAGAIYGMYIGTVALAAWVRA